jgi:hypothetical protein
MASKLLIQLIVYKDSKVLAKCIRMFTYYNTTRHAQRIWSVFAKCGLRICLTSETIQKTIDTAELGKRLYTFT